MLKQNVWLSTLLTSTLLFGGVSSAASNYEQYTVKTGDTFWIISQKLGVSMASLQEANPTVQANNLIIGSQVNIPSVKYTVASGDTMKTIAKKLNISLSELIATNTQLSSFDNIYPGMTLNIPSETLVKPVTPTLETRTSIYQVVSGDTLKSVCAKLGVSLPSMIAANPQISNFDILYPGMMLNIPSSNSVTPPSIKPVPNQGSDTIAEAVITAGKTQLGVPYVFGGDQPGVASDCSGFTQYVFGQVGILLPHSSEMQSQMGTPVEKDQLKKGDLVFFQNTYKPGVSHVGVYMGDNQFIQAGTMGTREVKISTLFGTPYYDEHYWGARRITQ